PAQCPRPRTIRAPSRGTSGMPRSRLRAEWVDWWLLPRPVPRVPTSTSPPGCACVGADRDWSPAPGDFRARSLEAKTSSQPNVDQGWQKPPCKLARARLCRLRHAPNSVADIVGDQQRAIVGDCHSDWPSKRLVVITDKTGEDIDRIAGWLPIRKSNEH